MKQEAFSVDSILSFYRDAVLLKRGSKVFSTGAVRVKSYHLMVLSFFRLCTASF